MPLRWFVRTDDDPNITSEESRRIFPLDFEGYEMDLLWQYS
jgi:hypothetical protein